MFEGLTRPCEEDLARYDVHELDMVDYFDEPLYPSNQLHFADQIEVLALTVFRCDGDMIDEDVLRGIANGSGRSFELLEIHVRKTYRDSHFPINEDGTVTEPLDWSYFESRCKNAKLSVKFYQYVCEHRNVNCTVSHFIKVLYPSNSPVFEIEPISEIKPATFCVL